MALCTGTALANPFAQVKGSWQGAVQLEDSTTPEAHAVGRLSAHIGADGAIDAVHANGCKLSGVVRQDSPASFRIDARMTGCSHAPFNRRWGGYFNFDASAQTVRISLSSTDIVPKNRIRQVDASGTLMR